MFTTGSDLIVFENLDRTISKILDTGVRGHRPRVEPDLLRRRHLRRHVGAPVATGRGGPAHALGIGVGGDRHQRRRAGRGGGHYRRKQVGLVTHPLWDARIATQKYDAF